MILARRHEPRRGVVLLAVLVVVVLLSLAAYKYSDYMMSEYHAADSSIRAAQARAFADSGVIYTAASLADTTNTTLSSNPYDNASTFQDILVPSSDSKARPGRFSIVSLRRPEDIANGGQAFRFGVTDEASKINLNAILQLDNGKGDIAYKMLMALPNMTDEVANAIVDWLDPDDTARQNGAETETYSSLTPSYQTKNGPLDSLEELLLVRGVTPQLLFGNDRNRNGVLDPGEDDGTGQVNLGWAAYLTVYSREPNVDSTGNARLYLNDPDLDTLSNNLNAALGSADLVNYILAYRMYGGSAISQTPGGRGPARPTGTAMSSINSQINSSRTGAASGGKKQQLQD